MCVPVFLVSNVPPGAQMLPSRSLAEIVNGDGDPRTLGELYHDLVLALSNEFPDFRTDQAATLGIWPPKTFEPICRSTSA
jgi:hypothetical protein